jgi:hypothetical protein
LCTGSTSHYPCAPDLVLDSVADLVGRTADPFGGCAAG